MPHNGTVVHQNARMVFAPGSIASGALAGEYTGATAPDTMGVGVGANLLLGGSGNRITLQLVSVEGSVAPTLQLAWPRFRLRKVP